jgi:ribosome recycling factor
MEVNQVVEVTKHKLDKAIDHFGQELSKLRTGRASSAMLDGVMAEVYGQQMPLNQVANITAPEAQLLQITPFDPNNLSLISNAIRDNQSLGLNPNDDGRVVRVPVPPLTEERRLEISKQVGVKLEEAMISMRGIRHEALDEIGDAKKDKKIGEDEAKRMISQIEESMNQVKTKADNLAKAKEQEIMTV